MHKILSCIRFAHAFQDDDNLRMAVDSLYGYKHSQSQGYTADGVRVPLTWIKMQPNVVTRTSSSSLQVALGKKKNLSKSLQGILNKLPEKITTPLHFREIKIHNSNVKSNEGESQDFTVGQKINADQVFVVGDKVKVTGTMIGKGFAGVVKRHGFKGGPHTHGQSDRERHPGSIGQTTTPGRVYKGKRMAGHMGTTTVTIRGLKVFEIKPEENLIAVQGLVPGGKNGLVRVTKQV